MKLLRTVLFIALVLLVACAAVWADAMDDARKAHGAGQLDNAISLYQIVVQQGSYDQARDAQFAIAACLFAQKKYDDAYNAFIAYSKDYTYGPDSVLALVHAGNVRVEQGRPDDGKPLFDQALTHDQTAPFSYLWVSWANLGEGRVLTADKNYQAAVPYLLKAIQGASEQRVIDIATDSLNQCVAGLKQAGQATYAQQWLGESELNDGQWQINHEEFAKAQAVLTEACTNLTAAGTLGEAQVLLGRTYLEAKDWPSCLSKASAGEQTLLKDPDANQLYASLLGKAYTYQARAYLETKQYQKCVDECEAMRANIPSPGSGELVESYMLETDAQKLLGKPFDAIATYKKFRASYLDTEMRARAGLQIAGLYVQMRDNKDAIASLKDFIPEAEGVPELQDLMRYMLGDCLELTGDTADALTLFKVVASGTSSVQTLAQQRLATLQGQK